MGSVSGKEYWCLGVVVIFFPLPHCCTCSVGENRWGRRTLACMSDTLCVGGCRYFFFLVLIKGLLCTFLYERGYSWLGLFCPWAHFLRSNMFLFQSVKCICCSFFSPIFHSSCLGDWLLHIFHSADWVPFMSASVFAKVHVLPIHCSLLHKPGYLTACVCPSHHYSPCWLLKYSHV